VTLKNKKVSVTGAVVFAGGQGELRARIRNDKEHFEKTYIVLE
jgi:hypothetical protein